MRSRIYLKLSFVILNMAILVGGGFNLNSDALAQNSTSEMQSVMGYMGNKLSISIAPKGSSCIGGTVTGSSCDITTCNVTTSNVTQSSVNQGSGTLTCNAGYSGSPTYTCSSGVFTPTGGSCTAITCSASGITGINNGTSFPYASSGTSFNCNASGYTGTVTYTCTSNGANPSVSANNCILFCTSGSQTFNYTGSSQSFSVPTGLLRL